MTLADGVKDRVKASIGAPHRVPAPPEVERSATVGSYYSFRRELDLHDPRRAQGYQGGQAAAAIAAWQQDLQPGGRADAVVESHFGHPLSSPIVELVRHAEQGRLLRIVLTWRGHRSARVIWTEQDGLADIA